MSLWVSVETSVLFEQSIFLIRDGWVLCFSQLLHPDFAAVRFLTSSHEPIVVDLLERK